MGFIEAVRMFEEAHEDLLYDILRPGFVMRDEERGARRLDLIALHQAFQPAKIAGFHTAKGCDFIHTDLHEVGHPHLIHTSLRNGWLMLLRSRVLYMSAGGELQSLRAVMNFEGRQALAITR